MLPTDLPQQLNDDIATARRLLELAEEEFQVLTRRDMPRLEALLSEKQPLLSMLAQHGSQRGQLLASRRLPADRSGLAQLLTDTPERERTLAQADALGDLLEACRNANERNGRLIRANQAAVGSILHILGGNQDAPRLYDNRGGTARTGRQRPLSQA